MQGLVAGGGGGAEEPAAAGDLGEYPRGDKAGHKGGYGDNRYGCNGGKGKRVFEHEHPRIEPEDVHEVHAVGEVGDFDYRRGDFVTGNGSEDQEHSGLSLPHSIQDRISRCIRHCTSAQPVQSCFSAGEHYRDRIDVSGKP